MKERFLLGAFVFHALYGAACIWVGRRWHQRRSVTRGAWLHGALVDALRLGLVALAAAGLAALVGPPSGFTVFRYLAQGLFGETIVLAAMLAWSHSRAALRIRAALLGGITLGLLGVYGEAYHREPTDLRVRRHPAVLPSRRCFAAWTSRRRSAPSPSAATSIRCRFDAPAPGRYRPLGLLHT